MTICSTHALQVQRRTTHSRVISTPSAIDRGSSGNQHTPIYPHITQVSQTSLCTSQTVLSQTHTHMTYCQQQVCPIDPHECRIPFTTSLCPVKHQPRPSGQTAPLSTSGHIGQKLTSIRAWHPHSTCLQINNGLPVRSARLRLNLIAPFSTTGHCPDDHSSSP